MAGDFIKKLRNRIVFSIFSYYSMVNSRKYYNRSFLDLFTHLKFYRIFLAMTNRFLQFENMPLEGGDVIAIFVSYYYWFPPTAGLIKKSVKQQNCITIRMIIQITTYHYDASCSKILSVKMTFKNTIIKLNFQHQKVVIIH